MNLFQLLTNEHFKDLYFDDFIVSKTSLNICLIGSTGMGKSSLGNFLVYPKSLKFKYKFHSFEKRKGIDRITKFFEEIEKDKIDEKIELEFQTIGENLLEEEIQVVKDKIKRKNYEPYIQKFKEHFSDIMPENKGEIKEMEDVFKFYLKFVEYFSYKKKEFRTAITNTPETTTIQYHETKIHVNKKEIDLNIIDTPGLNEDPVIDFFNTFQLVKHLKEIKKLDLLLICVKYDQKIDVQFKSTLEFYSKIFKEIFMSANVLIVLNDVKTTDEAEMQRELNNRDILLDIYNIQKIIREELNLSYLPDIVAIDNLPPTTDELENSMKSREYIFRKSLKSKEFPTSELKLLKTNYIRNKDENNVISNKAKVEGYEQAIVMLKKEDKGVWSKIFEVEKKILTYFNVYKKSQADLLFMNTRKEKAFKIYSFNKTWKFFIWQTENFSVSTDYEIDSYIFDGVNGCGLKILNFSKNNLKGEVTSPFSRGIYASITFYTMRSKFYKYEIEKCSKEKTLSKNEIMNSKSELDKLKEKRKDLLHKIDEYLIFTENLNNENFLLSNNFIELNEALTYLKKYKEQEKYKDMRI